MTKKDKHMWEGIFVTGIVVTAIPSLLIALLLGGQGMPTIKCIALMLIVILSMLLNSAVIRLSLDLYEFGRKRDR